ncbi:hypothetical protein RND71_028617 [Anisodus tanguticus]|uniref:Uncharacterized protein n=1 Tax=Anisodus tanguticus TaxID=243964 RepID=A0AAE1RIS2_9SOLA|nr:hypothetical protein RND71_028617 [Anisodus tanguticus]
MLAGVFSNGAVHWVFNEQYIRLDFDEEKVMLMTHAFIFGGHDKLDRLWQWGGTVYLALRTDHCWSFYELDQGTFKWTWKKYCIFPYYLSKYVLRAITKKEGTEQGRRYDLAERKYSVIAVVKGHKEVDTVVLAAVFGRVVLYSLALRKVKIIIDLKLPDDFSCDVCRNCISAHQYIETVSCLTVL